MVLAKGTWRRAREVFEDDTHVWDWIKCRDAPELSERGAPLRV